MDATLLSAILAEVSVRLPEARKKVELNTDEFWLTLNLMGDPKPLQDLADQLTSLGWINLSGAAGAFLHPKKRVVGQFDAISAAITEAFDLALRYGIDLIHIDADSDSDPEKSILSCLYAEQPTDASMLG